jgi:HEAT repeat protein
LDNRKSNESGKAPMKIADQETGVLILAISIGICGCSGVRRVDYSVEKLTATLQDRDPNMRYWAAESLGHFGPEAKSAVPDLVTRLKDDDKLVRAGAAYALAEIGPHAESSRGALQESVKDPEKEVRDAASYALRQINAKPAAKAPKR